MLERPYYESLCHVFLEGKTLKNMNNCIAENNCFSNQLCSIRTHTIGLYFILHSRLFNGKCENWDLSSLNETTLKSGQT